LDQTQTEQTWEDDGAHPLQNAWTFWFMKRSNARSYEAKNYEKGIKKIGDFKTVEGFWKYYNHMIRPHEQTTSCDYNLFKSGIKPMWEDEANKKGGKLILRVKKGASSKYWEDLLLAVIGEQIQYGEEVCGVVLSIRYNEDIISVWTRDCNNRTAKHKIQDDVKSLLSLPVSLHLDYKNHDDAIKDSHIIVHQQQKTTPPAPSSTPNTTTTS